MLPVLTIVAVLSRFSAKAIDIGLGPEPLINNVYHATALRAYGYSVETFVTHTYYITKEFDKILFEKWGKLSLAIAHYGCAAFLYAALRYKSLYIYFNGGCLFDTVLLWRIEPWLCRLARIRIVVMPYGGDVQVLTRCPNPHFRHVVAADYPSHRKARKRIAAKIDLWTNHADHVISGCDWVDYMHHWDTLMLAHFSIDLRRWSSESRIDPDPTGPLRILHAPNHRNIKGTRYFIEAIEALRAEGLHIELIMAERVPNERIRDLMQAVDVVADQLIIGWYAMFALEGMAAGKPVLCYLREDLVRLYTDVGLVRDGEIPLVRCTAATIKDVIRDLATSKRDTLQSIGLKGQEFVRKHHSVEAVGRVFDAINRRIGITPTRIDGDRGALS